MRYEKSWFKKAQSTAEYATLFAIIVGAVVAMQLFVKRAANAKLKDSMEYFLGANGLNVTGKHQYVPYYATKHITQTQSQQSRVSYRSNFGLNSYSNMVASIIKGSNEVQENEAAINKTSF